MENLNNIKNLPRGVTYNFAAGFIGESVVLPEKIVTLNRHQLKHFSSKNYGKNGFYIGCVKNDEERKKIDVLQGLMEREAFKTRNSCLPVFNTLSSNDDRMKKLGAKRFANCKIDGGRNMIHISSTKEKQLVEHATTVGFILRDKIASDLNLSNLERRSSRSKSSPMVLTLLETEPAVRDNEGDIVRVPDQLIHCDVDPDDISLDRPDSFIGVLATQKEGFTELRVVPRSHLLRKQAQYMMPQYIYRLQLPQYYYFVGHPFLLHSGCGSLLRNTRLHFYHGLSVESQSKTFFIKWELSSVHDEMKKVRATMGEAFKTAAKKRKLALIGLD